MRLTNAGKAAAFLIVAGVAYGGFRLWKGTGDAPSSSSNGTQASTTGGNPGTPGGGGTKIEGDLGLTAKLGRPLKVAVNQWPGWLGGIFANNGLNPNKACLYWKEHNILVEFVVMDDPVAMTNEFAAGRIDLAWSTMDTAATALGGLKRGGAPSKILFQVDYSQGGDAIIARPGINRFEDLAGKTVALIPLSPSDTLLRYGVSNSSLSESQKKGILNGKISQELPNAVVSTFAAGKADAIVTWEPNISAALKEVRGSKVIFSTESAANLIGDCFFAKTEFINQHGAILDGFIRGWFNGARQAQNDPQRSIQVMMDSFPDFKALGQKGSLDTLNKVKLTTLADNAKTFGLDGSTPLFNTIFSQANGFYVDSVQDQVSPGEAKDDRFIRTIFTEQDPAVRVVTKKDEFKVTPEQRLEAVKKTPVFTKPVSINFATGNASLSAASRRVLDAKVIPLLQTASNAVFRIEGNTDNVGSYDSNVGLSQRRANAVVSYLVSRGFSAERLIPIGNGPSKPVASNSTEAGRQANRRTDIKVVTTQ